MKRPENKSLQTELSMNSSQPTPGQPGREPGALLRHWRDTRGKSQLDLLLDSGLSQRPPQLGQGGKDAEFFLNDHHSRRTGFDHRARTSHGMYVSGGRRMRKESP